jgi:transcription initiation factor TFIIIB Brf1 subunit/transcription initiation factor TFIIB
MSEEKHCPWCNSEHLTPDPRGGILCQMCGVIWPEKFFEVPDEPVESGGGSMIKAGPRPRGANSHQNSHPEKRAVCKSLMRGWRNG